MKILVTGASGFIGYHVSESLLRDGHEVVGYDNFNDYYSVKLKRDRQEVLLAFNDYTGIEADLADREALFECFNEHEGFDVVCHLAAQAGVRYSLTHPHVYEQSNIRAFLNILEICRNQSVHRLVYASSSSVYGGNTNLPFSETDRVDTPVSLYAATKKANELMAHTYSHLFGLQTVGLRFFTVYGPWGRPDMAIWLFTQAMLQGRPINVFNHGDMQRDFTFIADIVSGVKSCLFAENLEQYEILNLGNHRSEQLLDVIDILSHELGIEPQMEMLPMQP